MLRTIRKNFNCLHHERNISVMCEEEVGSSKKMVNLNTSSTSSYHIKLSFCASTCFGHLIVVIIGKL
jgi:hypothetical protein